MTPLSFDPDTAREMVGDQDARSIEAKARSDADALAYSPPAPCDGASYWEQVLDEMRHTVYFHQYKKRMDRNARKVASVATAQ